jgi:hypothetical protein
VKQAGVGLNAAFADGRKFDFVLLDLTLSALAAVIAALLGLPPRVVSPVPAGLACKDDQWRRQ